MAEWSDLALHQSAGPMRHPELGRWGLEGFRHDLAAFLRVDSGWPAAARLVLQPGQALFS